MLDTGLYWRPLGGNNIDQISGHCYQYTCVERRAGKKNITTIIVDLGKFDNFDALGIKGAIAAVPDIRDILADDTLNLKAVFLTHSHPDHLNGIFHYLRAGYKLPTLYGGRYTQIVLEDMYEYYAIPQKQRPQYVIIKDGDVFEFDGLKIEVLSSSHTCFDAYGFLISKKGMMVYHSGDMKLDNTTFFKKPTNINRLREVASEIKYVVADFCEIDQEGMAYRERDVYKTIVDTTLSSRKKKIYLPVYPTHVEMYIIAFLAALKLRKNIAFCGDDYFYSYLNMLKLYGIDFAKMAKGRVKFFEHLPKNVKELGNEFAIIGSYNRLEDDYLPKKGDGIAFITARYYFTPLKKQIENAKVVMVTINDKPQLRGTGHAFLGDWEYLSDILYNAVIIPTHCPIFVLDIFYGLGKLAGINLINTLPHNNEMYRLRKDGYELIKKQPAVWLIADKSGKFRAVPQCPTAGRGMIKRTYSKRRVAQKIRIIEYKMERKHVTK